MRGGCRADGSIIASRSDVGDTTLHRIVHRTVFSTRTRRQCCAGFGPLCRAALGGGVTNAGRDILVQTSWKYRGITATVGWSRAISTVQSATHTVLQRILADFIAANTLQAISWARETIFSLQRGTNGVPTDCRTLATIKSARRAIFSHTTDIVSTSLGTDATIGFARSTGFNVVAGLISAERAGAAICLTRCAVLVAVAEEVPAKRSAFPTVSRTTDTGFFEVRAHLVSTTHAFTAVGSAVGTVLIKAAFLVSAHGRADTAIAFTRGTGLSHFAVLISTYRFTRLAVL